MINSIHSTLQKITLVFTIITATALLHGCGGERKFNDTSNSHGKELTVVTLASPDNISAIGGNINNDEKTDVMEDNEAYLALWGKYVNEAAPSVDFSINQVVLYDAGLKNTCEAQFQGINNVKAYADGTVIINVSESRSSLSSAASSAESSSSASSCASSGTTHKFAFYKIPTRVPLFISWE